MIKYLFTIVLVHGWIINYLDTCSCSQLVLSTDCTQSAYQCQWNSTTNTCLPFDCSVYTTQKTCSKQINCYYNTTACVPFISCYDVPFNNAQQCKSIGCSYTSGNNCTHQTCNQYNTTNCPKACYNTGMQCLPYTDCSQYTQNNCPNNEACQWNNAQAACLQATCSDFNLKSCMLIQNLNSELFSPCTYQSNQCIFATGPEQFPNAQMCYTNTNGRYYWNGTTNYNGSCVPCQPNNSINQSTNQTNTTIQPQPQIGPIIIHKQPQPTDQTTTNQTVTDQTTSNQTTTDQSNQQNQTSSSDQNQTNQTTSNQTTTNQNSTNPTADQSTNQTTTTTNQTVPTGQATTPEATPVSAHSFLISIISMILILAH